MLFGMSAAGIGALARRKRGVEIDWRDRSDGLVIGRQLWPWQELIGHP